MQVASTNLRYTLPDASDLTFDDILAPIGAEEFFAEYHDRKPLHIPGGGSKFSSLMSWDGLNSLLNMSSVWTPASLQLALNGEMVPPSQYCRPSVGTEGNHQLRPDAEAVTRFLKQGASLVANDIDTLTPDLAAIANALETALNGKAQTNLYCSWRAQRAFNSHFDTHDVYAIHTLGEKVWHIYEGRLDNPIAHPGYKNFGHEYHEQHKGRVVAKITMQPGDLLYIPRGQYHDALASSDGTIHVSFGVTAVIGLDLLTLLYDHAVADSLFRANVPRPSDETAVVDHLAQLAERLSEIVCQPTTQENVVEFQRDFRYRRGGFTLPIVPISAAYRVASGSLNMEQKGTGWVLTSKKGEVAIPAEYEEQIRWVIARKRFLSEEFGVAFPDTTSAGRESLLTDLSAMKVIQLIK
jgi:bifunctional lysine-specific demethylase and histidyl-hydroxylase MINA